MELYIHIPFCVRKCDYCDFLSFPADAAARAAYMEALLREVGWAAGKGAVETVFIGGGTPSVLETEWIRRLLDAVYDGFSVAGDAEITIEANPGTLTREKLKGYREAGINRLSMGLQSMDDRELYKLGRIHTAAEFLENFYMAREAGFDGRCTAGRRNCWQRRDIGAMRSAITRGRGMNAATMWDTGRARLIWGWGWARLPFMGGNGFAMCGRWSVIWRW